MSLVPVLDPFTVLSGLAAALGLVLAVIGVATGVNRLASIVVARVSVGGRRDEVPA